jgi:predicted DNA-binding transcriptional regulator AlpA
MATTEPMLMSRKETMAMLGGMSYDTFRRLLAQGSFPEGIRIGRRVRWNRATVIEHLTTRR